MKVTYEGNYFQLPNSIFHHHLTGNAFMLYSYLISKSSSWLPRKNDIQMQLNLGKDAVDTAFLVLIRHGFLVKDKIRKDKAGKTYQSYKLNPAAESKPSKNLPELPKKKKQMKATENSNNEVGICADNPHHEDAGNPLKEINANAENPTKLSRNSAPRSEENPQLQNTDKNKEIINKIPYQSKEHIQPSAKNENKNDLIPEFEICQNDIVEPVLDNELKEWLDISSRIKTGLVHNPEKVKFPVNEKTKIQNEMTLDMLNPGLLQQEMSLNYGKKIVGFQNWFDFIFNKRKEKNEEGNKMKISFWVKSYSGWAGHPNVKPILEDIAKKEKAVDDYNDYMELAKEREKFNRRMHQANMASPEVMAERKAKWAADEKAKNMNL